jgi:hypothetical protein
MILAFIFNYSAYAYDAADGNITITAGSFIYRTIFQDTSKGATSGYHGDFGLIMNGDLDEKGSLEIALFHMNKLYSREEESKSQVEQTQVMHISMGYRRWVNPYLSGALGFYSAYPMDDTKVVHTDFAPGTEIKTSARDKTEYGFDFSIQSEVWSNNVISVVADARYAWSVTNLPNEKGDHYGFMLGVKYLFKEKYPRKKPQAVEKKKVEPRTDADGKLIKQD